jgi:hypothetical protein
MPENYSTVILVFLIGFALLLVACVSMFVQQARQGLRGDRVSQKLAIGYALLILVCSWAVFDTWIAVQALSQ